MRISLKKTFVLVLSLFAAPAAAEPPEPAKLAAHLEERVAKDYASLDALYKHFHSHPELSLFEEQTAKRLAKELAAAGFTVTGKIGGHGVVGVLKNGKGRTILVRADMDALPIE